ncbi:hypothetical protein ACIPSE_45850 [Streptomyces sp. NPDC090106]|uniref:hypothetical protein n=1 Tax=Streptomyces sp. NPDC090106 TaxID=3365946 RepID=UPI0038242028
MTVLRAYRIGWGVWADLIALHLTTGTDVTVVHHAELPVDLAHLHLLRYRPTKRAARPGARGA